MIESHLFLKAKLFRDLFSLKNEIVEFFRAVVMLLQRPWKLFFSFSFF